MKMSSVIQPQTYSQNSEQSLDEMLHGLSWIGSTDDDLLSGLSGLGALAKRALPAKRGGGRGMSAMDAVIRNAMELNIKTTIIQQARMEVAKRSPSFAMKLFTALKKAVPGTNIAAGVKQAATAAAAKAIQAKKLEAKAATLLRQNDKRGAAAEAVNALTKAREALVLANSAEKTRLTSSLDQVAHTLDSQAAYVDNQMANERARSGQSARTDALRGKAQQLRAQATKLRTQSAVVAAAPVVPPNAPTPKRIAEVANKFNVRSVGAGHQQGNVTSVLSDLSESAMAQVKDYDGALQFYGRDAVGHVMCDMEFGNRAAALKGLQGAIHGMGYVDTMPLLADADAALAEGVRAAQEGYVNAVLPAFASGANLKGLQVAAVQLGGFGAADSDHEGSAAAEPSTWDSIKSGIETGLDIFKTVTPIVTTVVKAVTPPANTRPPLTLPGATGSTGGAGKTFGTRPVATTVTGTLQRRLVSGGSLAPSLTLPGGYRLPQLPGPAGNTMLYVSIAGGVLVLGAGVYLTMFRKPARA